MSLDRRDFLSLLPATAVAAQKKKKPGKNDPPPPPPPPMEQVATLFLDVTKGFLTNAAKTSPSMAVVEYPGATVTKGFLAKSGLSATGVTRMLPAMAAWVVGKRGPDSGVADALVKAYKNGCDPAHADYWQASPAGTQNQRQVESSIVAWSLWVARDVILPALSEAERKNVAAWLESCTKVAVRGNNWAWFTAVNLAVRMRLSEKWPEFQGDAAFMLADLKVLDSMATGDSGWYNDGFKGTAYDYYNSWVFASHFLYWNALVGERYPEWRQKFSTRLTRYLETAPYFFAGHGGHVLYGRSLIYRWGVLTPLVLAYQQKLWPHSPALLRSLVERNVLWHRDIGGFDGTAGKLRESLTPDGTMDVKESYIDGGHPYWGMQAFAFWTIPADDPFWSAAPEPLPIDKSDFAIALPEAGMLLVGSRASGQVRIFNGKSTRADLHYRDKYNKLCYSSHFPFAVNHLKGKTTIDNTVVLRNRKTGETAGRGEVTESSVEAEKVELEYAIQLGGVTAKVATEIRFQGDYEARIHRVEMTGGPMEDIEIVEGGAGYTTKPVYPEAHLKTWKLKGWTDSGVENCEGSVLFGPHQVQVLKAQAAPRLFLASLRYQSPKGLPKDKIDEQAGPLLQRLKL